MMGAACKDRLCFLPGWGSCQNSEVHGKRATGCLASQSELLSVGADMGKSSGGAMAKTA